MMKPKQLARSLAATARLARAVSKTYAKAEEQDAKDAVLRSAANQQVRARLRRLRRTELPASEVTNFKRTDV